MRSSIAVMLFLIISKLETKLSCTPTSSALLLSSPEDICPCNSSRSANDLLQLAAEKGIVFFFF